MPPSPSGGLTAGMASIQGSDRAHSVQVRDVLLAGSIRPLPGLLILPVTRLATFPAAVLRGLPFGVRVWLPFPVLFALPTTGLFMSVLYPTINSTGISCFDKGRHGAVAGLLLFFTCVSAVAKPIAFADGTTVMAEYGAGTMTESRW